MSKGFAPVIVLVIAAIVVVGVGGYFVFVQEEEPALPAEEVVQSAAESQIADEPSEEVDKPNAETFFTSGRSSFYISANSSGGIKMQVIDPLGNKVGYDSLTGKYVDTITVDEISRNASVFSDGVNHIAAHITQPIEGEYTIVLSPNSAGFIFISARYDRNGNFKKLSVPPLEAYSSSTVTYKLRYSSISDTNNQLKFSDGDAIELINGDIRLAQLVVTVKASNLEEQYQPQFQIIDPQMRRAGYDVINDKTVFEIPQSSYYQVPLGDEYNLSIGGPQSGEYKLLIFPRKLGTLNIYIAPSDVFLKPLGVIRDTIDISSTSTIQYAINYSSEPGAKVDLSQIK